MDNAKKIIEQYAKRNLMIVTAESCTGGMIAAALTDIAGSSKVFERGFVTYSNEAKLEMLGVDDDVLNVRGAVSEEIALEMALGALGNSHANVALSVTGIAGPGGGTRKKPVGLVYMGIAKGRYTQVHKFEWGSEKSREEIRQATVARALDELLAVMDR